MSFLTVREQAVSVRGVSRFLRKCSDVYIHDFLSEPILHLPQDGSLARAMEMCQHLMRQEGYVEGTTMVVALGSGVHEVVESWADPEDEETYQKTLYVPCDNVSFVGQGTGETIVHGCFVVMNGRKASFEGLTMKNSSWNGLHASGAGTKIVLKNVTVADCTGGGVVVKGGAKLDATGCQFHQNGNRPGFGGVGVDGSRTTARLTNCTSHHNKGDGVYAYNGAVVDLMGEGTSVHDNERYGLLAVSRGTTINVYQPCVLNDMSHGNKGQNINMVLGTVQQKESKK